MMATDVVAPCVNVTVIETAVISTFEPPVGASLKLLSLIRTVAPACAVCPMS